MKRIISFVLAVALVLTLALPVGAVGGSGSESDVKELAYSIEYANQWTAMFESWYPDFGDYSFTEAFFIDSFWGVIDKTFSRSGFGRFDSLSALEQAAYTFNRALPSVWDVLLSGIVRTHLPHATVGYISDLSAYALYDANTGLVLTTQGGAYAYYREPEDAESAGGGKWLGSRSCDPNGKVVILTEDVLSNLCLTLNEAGESCMVTTWGTKYQVICKDSYYYYCSPDGYPYVARIDNNYAVDTPNNYYTENEGDNIYNTGDTVTNNLIDNSTSTVWFPDGTLNYIDQLIYDESTKTYYVDAHEEYNTTNNTYVSNTYQYEYHIDYTSITYIGSTAEYDEEYQLYYELPDGRSSADLTADELAALNVSMDVIPYVRSADDTSIRALYHFDGDTLDSSYWSYRGDFTWAEGASITYMEANAFNGALYLDETAHDFTVTLPGNLVSGDFTIQFRYYQSATADPTVDSFVQISDVSRLVLNGSQFMDGSGTVLTATSVGTWQDVCLMRKDGVLYYFVNGVCYGSQSDTTVYEDTIRFYFGSFQQTYKYLDELRVLNVAAYDTTGYTPSSVPFDTNLSLVLPDSSVPVADEYWDFQSDGNLFWAYDWVGATMDTSIFRKGLPSNLFGPFGSPAAWIYSGGSASSDYVSCLVMNDFVRIYNSNSSLVTGRQLYNLDGSALYFPLAMRDYDPDAETSWVSSSGLLAELDESKTYTFSVMLSDGSVHSVSASLSSMSYGSSVVTQLPNGGAIQLLHSMDFGTSRYGYVAYAYIAAIVPPPEGSMDVVYVELVEGSVPNTGHEFVSGVLVMDSEDIDKATLAVRTDIEITGYQIGGVRPSLPTKGLVWALVESGRITSLQVYNGQAWEEVDGRIWTGYRWIPYYAFDVLLLKDMYDVVEYDPTLDPIYTQSGFWSWLQNAWTNMIRKLDLIIMALGGDPDADPSNCDHEYQETITVAVTCETDGEASYTCSLCEHTYKEVIKATGHVWTVTETVGAGSGEYVFVDSIDQCTDTAKQYVLPDGYVYAYQDLGEDARLPSEYQELEHIEANGAQYIDTSVIPADYPDGIHYKFDGYYAQAHGSNSYLWGCLADGSRSGNAYVNVASESLWFFTGGASSGLRYVGVVPGSEIHIDCFGTSVTNANISGVFNGSVMTPLNAGSFAAADMPSLSIYLLWSRGVGSTSKPFIGQMDYFSMADASGSLIREYIPAYRKSDGVIGAYDTVTGVFYTNAGTGSFSAGPEVHYDHVYAWTSTGVQYDKATAGYDVLTCSKCGATAKDYGTGPEDIVVPEPEEKRDIFDSLGDFVAEGISWILDKLQELADSLSGITDTFNSFVDRVASMGGAFPAFFGAFMALIPEDLSAVLWFAVVAFVVLAVWRKWTE